ncbi:hypothetical protein [Carnimonas bestiolae]
MALSKMAAVNGGVSKLKTTLHCQRWSHKAGCAEYIIVASALAWR